MSFSVASVSDDPIIEASSCVARADVPEEKAANIALGTVASKARTALIDACAAYREQDSQVTPSLIPA